MRTLGGLDDPDDTDRPDPEVPIRITVPQEYAGWSMSEISLRRGFITGMDVDGDSAIIRARLPESQYAALAQVLAAGTRDSARLERDL